MEERVAFDVEAYVQRSLARDCFVCAMQRGEPGYEHEVIASGEAHIAFLSKYPILIGYALVAPKKYVERVVGDFSDTAFLAMMAFVCRVVQGVEAILHPERTYLLSLGSQQGNAHVHWHIGGTLPPAVPYREQQYHAIDERARDLDNHRGGPD